MIVGNSDWLSLPMGEAVKEGRHLIVPHGTAVKWARDALVEGGFNPGTQETWVAADGRDVVAVTCAYDPDEQEGDEPLCIGVRMSERIGTGFRWYHGITVKGQGGVCLFRPESAYRQTSEDNVRAGLQKCVDVLAVRQKKYRKTAVRLKAIKLSVEELKAHVIGRMRSSKHDRDRISWERLGKLLLECEKENYRTPWDVSLAMSRAAGGSGRQAFMLDQLYVFAEPWLARVEEEMRV